MESRFLYHAFGVGLGGRITRPFCDVIEAQAATALPTVGGYASSRVDGYRFKNIVSVHSAWAYAAGSEGKDGAYNTSITVTVEGLNILDVITAERLTARLASQHTANDRDPVISAVGSEFRDLRIGGHPIDVEVDDWLLEGRGFGDFNEGLKSKPRAGALQGNKGVVGCSPFKSRGNAPAGVDFKGNVIRVPTVGTIVLGELLVSQYARRLTMIRVELGSPVGGRLEAGFGESNGSTYP
jgi:hypothetical protein